MVKLYKLFNFYCEKVFVRNFSFDSLPFRPLAFLLIHIILKTIQFLRFLFGLVFRSFALSVAPADGRTNSNCSNSWCSTIRRWLGQRAVGTAKDVGGQRDCATGANGKMRKAKPSGECIAQIAVKIKWRNLFNCNKI